ncbi:MAG: response regulator [Alphaproteobacteria bacterium]
MDPAPPRQPHPPPRRILIVEDEPAVAEVAERALKSAGYAVLGPVSSEHEALLAVGRERPDLALLDICLKRGGDGVRLAKLLHDHWRIPVLFVSGSPEMASRGRAFALGIVQKPYSLRSLVDSVRFCEECVAGTAGEPPGALTLFPGARRFPRSG